MTKKLVTAAATAAFVGLAILPALAQHLKQPVGGTTTPPAATGTPPKQPPVDTACIRSAVEKREKAVLTAWEDFFSAMKKALEARSVAFKAALDNLNAADKEGRKQFLTVSADFRNTAASARKDFHKAIEAAHKQFQQDMKACRTGSGFGGLESTLRRLKSIDRGL